MPKLKTNKSAKKRFSVTGKGKVKRAQAGKRHLLGHKSSSRKRTLGQNSTVAIKAECDMIKKLLAK